MIKSLTIRSIIAGVVCLTALFFLTPSLTSNLPEFWKKNLPADKIPLGLDLQGGTHLVLEVDTEKAVEATLLRSAENLKETLMDKKVRFRYLDKGDRAKTIAYELPDAPSRTAFEKIVHDSFPDLEQASSETREGREVIALKIKDRRAEDIKKNAVEQSLETIRNRVDQFGVTEPEIIPEGRDRIVIQLPGIKDTAGPRTLSARPPF
jgi:preprotein translocase subunit SecD